MSGIGRANYWRGIAITFLFFVAPTVYAEAIPTSQSTAPETTGEILVHYANRTSAPENGVHAQALSDGSEVYILPTPFGMDPYEAAEQYAADPNVLRAEPQLTRRMTATPDDTFFSSLQHLSTTGIDAQEAWDTETGSADVVVAVVDTGLDTDHPDIVDNLWVNTGEIAGNSIDDDGNGYVDDVNGYDFVEGNGDPSPSPDGNNEDGFGGADNGVTHGTHVAGIAGAVGNNATGVTGVSWNVSIMALQSLDDEGAGTDSDIAEAIRYAADNGADVINMSLGGYGSTTVLQNAVEYAVAQGVVITAAAGNDGVSIEDNPFYPTCYTGVIGVAATDQSNDAAFYSNYGSDCVDIAAPGSSILSTIYADGSAEFTNEYGTLSGTSMATPVVSGVIALLYAQDSTLTAEQVETILTLTAEDIGLSEEYGAGKVNANTAVNGIELANYPSAPGAIRAYKNSQKNTEYTADTRTNDATPFFQWGASTDNSEVDGYYVYFGTTASANPVSQGTLQTARTFSPSTLEAVNDTTYYLRVRAVDDEGNVSSSTTSFAYRFDGLVKKPKNIQVQKKANGVNIRWDKVKNESIRRYQVFRRVVPATGSPNAFKKIANVAKSQKQYTDTTVRKGVQYEYRIRAVDDLANKNPSKRKRVQFFPREKVIAATGFAGAGRVQVINSRTQAIEQTWIPFGAAERASLEVASGNVNNSRKDEVIVTRGNQGAPVVKVVDRRGRERRSFFAYEPEFSGGVRIATGDIDNDGTDEIITVPGPGRTPEVRVFSGGGQLLRSFTVAGGAYTGGLFVAAVNWDGKGRDEIAVSIGGEGTAQVFIYDARNGRQLSVFEAFGDSVRSGVRVARHANGASGESLLVAPRVGRVDVRQFTDQSVRRAQADSQFTSFTTTYTAGGRISSGDLFQTGNDSPVVGSGGNRQSQINIFNHRGSTLRSTLIPFPGYRGAVQVASGWL